MPAASSRLGAPPYRLVGLAAGVAAVLLAAACSSSSSTSSSAASSPAASSSAASSSAASATGSAGGGLSSADQAGLAKAEAVLAQVEKEPTQITSTGKIGKSIPKNETIDWISCGATPECVQENTIIQQADDLLGWKTVVLNNNGTPQEEKAAFNQVVRSKPAAVLYSAIPASVFASEVPAMQKNGTFIAATSITDAVGSSTGVDYAISTPSQVPPIAGAQAALFASGSQDAGSVLVVNIPDFLILNISVADFKSALSTYCPTCSMSELNIALSNIGTATSTTVSYLRAHPSIKWVVAETDALTVGLPSALKAAGLSDVKVIGQGATPTNIQYLHTNDEYGDVAFDYYEELYAMVNAVAQHVAGVTVQPSNPAPVWVLTPSNAPATAAAAFPVVQDYKQQYAALWGVSG